jgi:hypothetical protein
MATGRGGNRKKKYCQHGLAENYGMVAIIQPDKTGISNSSGNLLKLKPGKKGEYDDKTTKQRKCLTAVTDKILRGFIDRVDQQNNNKVDKVSEHGLSISHCLKKRSFSLYMHPQ